MTSLPRLPSLFLIFSRDSFRTSTAFPISSSSSPILSRFRFTPPRFSSARAAYSATALSMLSETSPRRRLTSSTALETFWTVSLSPPLFSTRKVLSSAVSDERFRSVCLRPVSLSLPRTSLSDRAQLLDLVADRQEQGPDLVEADGRQPIHGLSRGHVLRLAAGHDLHESFAQEAQGRQGRPGSLGDLNRG